MKVQITSKVKALKTTLYVRKSDCKTKSMMILAKADRYDLKKIPFLLTPIKVKVIVKLKY